MSMNRGSKRPILGVGRVEGLALRAAIASPKRHGPITLNEALDAGAMLADEMDVVRSFICAGVAFDLMCSSRGVPRKQLAQRLRLSDERLRVYELTWELLDEHVRFDIVRRAAHIALAQRTGGRP